MPRRCLGDLALVKTLAEAAEKAPEGLKNVARGQSDEGAATPGQENRKIYKPPAGRQRISQTVW